MTEEQINIAIAESLGWKLHSELDETWCAPHQSDCPLVNELVPRPNYTTSLDACAEFEKSMDCTTCAIYSRTLRDKCDENPPSDVSAENYGWHASPKDRCEAYLRTMNLWKESK